MTWFGLLLFCYLALNAVLTVAMVGKKRDPLTPEAAAISVIINGALIAGLILVGTGHI